MPPQIMKFLRYVKSLSFDSKPNYNYLQSLLQSAAKENDINLSDNMFDWTLKAVIIKKYPLFYNKILASQYD